MSTSFAIDVSTSFKLEVSTALALCELVDTPRSLTVSLLIQGGEWRQLVDLSCDANDYEDHRNYADDYLVTSMLQKSASLPLDVDRVEQALNSFYESEERCRLTNERMLNGCEWPSYMKTVAQHCAKILGVLDTKTLEDIESKFRFGPGATTSVVGRGSSLSDKYDEEIHLTSDLMPFYRSIIGDRWWELQTHPTVVKGNRFTTVPKNAKTDRGICIEPSMNIYGQLGIGTYLKGRLKRFGIDLYSQERNQYLAQKAYTASLATIDLSAASDSLSWGTVLALVPQDWFDLLTLFRSPFTKVGDDWVELEKFSSMGNGYTFELETLVFYAALCSVVPPEERGNCSVYGDDIILPQKYAPRLVEVLEFLGFKTNLQKSFLAGNFFESCGTDWFKGQNVRPFFLRRQDTSKCSAPYVVQIANSLRLYASQRGGFEFCDKRFKPLWMTLRRRCPSVWRKCRVPAFMGDQGLISSLEEAQPHVADDYIEGYVASFIHAPPCRKDKKTFGVLLAGLSRQPVRAFTVVVHQHHPDGVQQLTRLLDPLFSYGREPKRGFLGKARPKRTVVPRWSEGLSWM